MQVKEILVTKNHISQPGGTEAYWEVENNLPGQKRISF